MNKDYSPGNSTLDERLLKVVKALNFFSGKPLSGEGLEKHRKAAERAGRLAAPRSNVKRTSFSVGDIPCEAFRPEDPYDPGYAILYAHGGGYTSGGLGYASTLAAKMAIATGFTAYTFAYRLAPEYPYPAALEDMQVVWEYLTYGRYNAEHIFIAGDSAGGNLALCMTQALAAGGKSMPKGLLLFSPWTDMTGNAVSYETYKDSDPILSKEYIMAAASAYTAGQGELSDPAFSPLFGNMEGLPPMLIMAGRNEILLDDSIRLNDAVNKAGGRALLDIEENGWHVYPQMPVPIAKRAMKRLSEYVSNEVNRNLGDDR